MVGIEDWTEEDVAEMIIERYEEEYCKMDDLRAIALLIPDVRQIKPELHLAIAYAGRYVFNHRPQGWRTVRNKMYSGNRIMNGPNYLRVMMMPAWTRAEMLMSHPRYIALCRDDEEQEEGEGGGLLR